MKAPVLLSALLPIALLGGCNSAAVAPTADRPAPLYTRLTDADVQLADRTVQQTLENAPSLEARGWENTRSGNSGAITPLRTFRNLDGYYCRTYRELLRIGRRSETYTDTACRSSKGIWYPI